MTLRERAKKLLKSNAIGRVMYEPLHKLWKLYNDPRRRRRLQRYGDEALQKLHEFFSKHNIGYYLDYGTLLGIVRDDGFIKHDDDIDLTIRESSIPPKEMFKFMKKEGFSFCHGFFANGKTIAMTVYWKTLSIDIFFGNVTSEIYDGVESYALYECYYVPETNYPSPDANNYKSWFFPISIKAKKRQFHGYEICLPDDEELLLEMEYGKNWRTPIKGFVADNDEFKIRIEDGFAFRTINPEELPN